MCIYVSINLDAYVNSLARNNKMKCETEFFLFSFDKKAKTEKLSTVRDKQIVTSAVEVLVQSGDSRKSNKTGNIGIKDSIPQRSETSYTSLTRALSFVQTNIKGTIIIPII